MKGNNEPMNPTESGSDKSPLDQIMDLVDEEHKAEIERLRGELEKSRNQHLRDRSEIMKYPPDHIYHPTPEIIQLQNELEKAQSALAVEKAAHSVTMLARSTAEANCNTNYARAIRVEQELEKVRGEGWTASLIDRLNEFARENRSQFEEVSNGKEAGYLVQAIHGHYNDVKQQLAQARRDGERVALVESKGMVLIHDDNGRWACNVGGFQPLTDGDKDITQQPIGGTWGYFVEPEDWKPTLRQAIDDAAMQSEQTP